MGKGGVAVVLPWETYSIASGFFITEMKNTFAIPLSTSYVMLCL